MIKTNNVFSFIETVFIIMFIQISNIFLTNIMNYNRSGFSYLCYCRYFMRSISKDKSYNLFILVEKISIMKIAIE